MATCKPPHDPVTPQYSTNYPSDTGYDLFGLGDSDSSPTSPIPPAPPNSPTALGVVGKAMAAPSRPVTAPRDSFSDLAVLMKAKKPYVTVPPTAPRLSLSAESNSKLCEILSDHGVLTMSRRAVREPHIECF